MSVVRQTLARQTTPREFVLNTPIKRAENNAKLLPDRGRWI